MPDISAIAGLATSLRLAGDITKGLIGLRDTTMIQSKVIELQGVILSAQSDALTAQAAQFALLEEVGDLKKQIAQMEKWDAEKQKYELKQIATGAFAYVLKSDANRTEAPHWLCTACYEKGKKAHLQKQATHGRDAFYKCPGCSAQLMVPWSSHPK